MLLQGRFEDALTRIEQVSASDFDAQWLVLRGQGELLSLRVADGVDLSKVELDLRNSRNEQVEYVLQAASDLPAAYHLAQNYPNPFNPETRIGFALPERSEVLLEVLTADGRLVATLVDGVLPAGHHEAVWTGRHDSGDAAASGLYLYRIETGPFRQTIKMLLLK